MNQKCIIGKANPLMGIVIRQIQYYQLLILMENKAKIMVLHQKFIMDKGYTRTLKSLKGLLTYKLSCIKREIHNYNQQSKELPMLDMMNT